MTVLLVLGVLIFIGKIFSCLDDSSETKGDCLGATRTGTILNGVCFALLSISLLAVIIPLFSALRALQQTRMELSKGVKMLALVFGIFTFCYATRTLYDWLVVPTLDFGNFFSGVSLPILWDFLPIFLMFTYSPACLDSCATLFGGLLFLILIRVHNVYFLDGVDVTHFR